MNVQKAFKKIIYNTSECKYNYLYLELFNKYPSLYQYTFGDDNTIDMKNLDKDKLHKFIKDNLHNDIVYTWSSSFGNDRSNSAADEGIDFKVFRGTNLANYTATYNVILKDYIISFTKFEVSIYHRCEEEFIISFIKKLIDQALPILDKRDEYRGKINLVTSEMGNYYCQPSSINPIDVNVDLMYNDDFKPVYEKTIEFLNSKNTGIILYRGNYGTGKTSLIKNLIWNCPQNYIYVPNNLMAHIGSPDFTTFVTENKNSVFILEDCEQVIQDRTYNQSISTILNMADGILSDVFNIKFICTCNCPIDNIDEAILRKGRCFANYEFKELEKKKVKKLVKELNLNVPKIEEDMTLADIFFYDKSDNNQKKKIGF